MINTCICIHTLQLATQGSRELRAAHGGDAEEGVWRGISMYIYIYIYEYIHIYIYICMSLFDYVCTYIYNVIYTRMSSIYIM